MLSKQFSVNEFGRDFVVGDLHGCHTLLEAALNHVNFDTARDRLFSVGDLVDRGPENVKCLQLLDKPWFHAVQGNHEQLMLHALTTQDVTVWFNNGGMWERYIEDELEAEIVVNSLDKINRLPLFMSVKLPNGMFHVVHSEIPENGHSLTDEWLIDPNSNEGILTLRNRYGDFEATWSRTIFDQLFASDHTIIGKSVSKKGLLKRAKHTAKVSNIFCGHTIIKQPIKIHAFVNIDTGAFASTGGKPTPWAGLTLAEPETNKFWTAKPSGVSETSVFIV